jgi:FAD/FMN-containing dehydrogenase/Fe-S oxidoreductase
MSWLKELKSALAGEVHAGPVHRSLYSTDASIYQIMPQAVVMPASKEDVINTVKIAARHKIPLAARGGGSGLAGESLCRGIVIDFPPHMNRVLSFDRVLGRIKVEPGLVFEDLNRHLAGTPWIFGPNPASGNRCTLGGMIANNSTGAYSLKYGFTADYLEDLEVVLADGTQVTLKPRPEAEARAVPFLGQTVDLIKNNQALIAQYTPKVKRNTAGYLLPDVWKDGMVDFTRLICGSECTLAVVVSATLRLSPRPKHKGMVVLQFTDLLDACRTVPRALESKPMAVEIMDRMLLDFANEASPAFSRLVKKESQAILIIEFDGETPAEVRDKIQDCQKRCAGQYSETFTALDPATMTLVWNLRKAGVPLLDRHGGERHPMHFIDDAAVPPETLAEFVARAQVLFKKYNTTASFFAHAGDGVLHLSPYLNLKDPADVAAMDPLAREFYDIVYSLNGSMSGEHGDGLSRTSYLPDQYGPLYQVFRRIKQLADPDNIMNPGKIISDDRGLVSKNLRFGAEYTLPAPALKLPHFGFVHDLEKCNGCGVCRSTQTGARMCPAFRGLTRELASTRAKVNILRDALSGRASRDILNDPYFREVMSLCLNCGNCALDCPSAVDTSSLVLEARAQYLPPSLADWFFGHLDQVSRLGSTLPFLANTGFRLPLARRLMELTTGVSRDAPMPPFAFGSLASRIKTQPAGGVKAVLFTDVYPDYYNHGLGLAFVALLRRLGVAVEIPSNNFAGFPLLAAGYADQARCLALANLQAMNQWIQAGSLILFTEPSAYLCVTGEYRKLVDPALVDKIQGHCFELTAWLSSHPGLAGGFSAMPKKAFYHQPCHQRSCKNAASREILSRVPSLTLDTADAGCCGMGGTFGLKAKNRETSKKISRSLRDHIQKGSYDFVVTECSSCRMQIEHLSGLPVYHPVEVLNMAL